MAEVYDIATPVERAEELARFVRSRAGDDAAAQAMVAAATAGDFSQVISIALEREAQIFKTATDEDIEGAFTLTLSFLKLIPQDQVVALVHKALDSATSTAEGKSVAVRLRMLANLYNSVDEAIWKDLKLAVFTRVVQYAADTKQLDLLAPFFAAASTWQSRWGISSQQAGALYLLISQSLDKAGALDDAQTFLIRYLSTLEEAGEAELASARPHAVTAAVNYVKAPVVSQRSNLPALRAVRSLASDPAYARLYELVDIFAHKSLDAYTAYEAAHKPYMTSLGLDTAKSMETMRLLTFCSLASTKHTQSYETVAAALQCSLGEVEHWIVRAISTGLVDARMDQGAGTVTVARTIQREFGPAQWALLQSRLRTWKDNVNGLLQVIEMRGNIM